MDKTVPCIHGCEHTRSELMRLLNNRDLVQQEVTLDDNVTREWRYIWMGRWILPRDTCGIMWLREKLGGE